MGTWILAIDYGTTSSAAAIANGSVALVEVGGAPRVPSVVMAAEDGTLIAGEVALRQGAAAPDRVERTPKRRIGDRVVVLGDHQFAPVDLAAAVIGVLGDEAIRQQGGDRPTEVRITHPASWAGTRLGVLRDAALRAGFESVSMVPEPVAAALHYAGDRLAIGDLVAVYDLGGGTFDTAVLRRTESGFDLVGPPGGSDRLGGEDFDERLYQHVGAALAAQDPDAWEHLRFSDERQWLRANSALRTEVKAAKEALSGTSEYTIYVPAPVDREVRVTRDELERLIGGDIERTVDELVATLDRAAVGLDDLAAVYLVGGSSRIPLVTRLLAERMGAVPVTWGDPKAVVVLGAAGAPREAIGAAPVAPAETPEDDTAVLSGVPLVSDEEEQTKVLAAPAVAGATRIEPSPAVAPVPPADIAPVPAAEVGRAGGRGRWLMVVAPVLALLVVAGAVFAFKGDGDKVESGDGGTSSTTESSTSTSEITEVEEGEPVATFAAEGDADLTAVRTFTYDGDGRFVNTTMLRNATAAPIKRVWFEVVPKELAATTADVDWSIRPSGVVVEDPVVYFEIELGAGAELALTWATKLPKDAKAEQAFLDKMATAHAAAVTAAKPAIDAKAAELAQLGAEVVETEIPEETTQTTVGPTNPTTPTTAATTTTRPPTVTTAAPNSAPSISVSNRGNDERQGVNYTVGVSDPQGDAVTVTISGLPSGLSASGPKITGTISHAAASVTTHRTSIKSKAFTVTVTARDSKGASSSKNFTWTVKDTHLAMPNYVGKYGCGSGCGESVPDVSAISGPPGFFCEATADGSLHDRVKAQSVAPGTAVAWGQTINYVYWRGTC